jgi:hypothetical protein
MMICNVISSFMDPLVMGLYGGVLYLNSTHLSMPIMYKYRVNKTVQRTQREERHVR